MTEVMIEEGTGGLAEEARADMTGVMTGLTEQVTRDLTEELTTCMRVVT